jgi:adenylate cyclase
LALGFPQIEMGIGIHRARAVLGTVGTEEHMENKVVSEGVNFGSRIERLTREYGGSILVSSSTLAHMENSRIYRHRRLGNIKVRGVNDKVNVIEILEG